MGDKLSQELDDLKAQVAKNTSVIESAKTLIVGFGARLDAAGADPVALKALRDDLASEDDALAAAVAANTPADTSTSSSDTATAGSGMAAADTAAAAAGTSTTDQAQPAAGS
jgi:hypothetical protein